MVRKELLAYHICPRAISLPPRPLTLACTAVTPSQRGCLCDDGRTITSGEARGLARPLRHPAAMWLMLSAPRRFSTTLRAFCTHHVCGGGEHPAKSWL